MLVAVGSIAATAVAVPALAERADARPMAGNDQRIADLQGLVDETTQDQADALKQYLEVKGRKDAADARVADAAGRTAAAAAVLQNAQLQVNTANQKIADTERKIARNETERKSAAATFKAAAIRRYINAWSGQPGPVSREEIPDYTQRAVGDRYLRAVAAKEDREVQRFLQLIEDGKQERARLDSQRVQLKVAQDRAAEEAGRVRAIQVEEEAARAVVAQEALAEKRVVDSLGAKKASYESELRAL